MKATVTKLENEVKTLKGATSANGRLIRKVEKIVSYKEPALEENFEEYKSKSSKKLVEEVSKNVRQSYVEDI